MTKDRWLEVQKQEEIPMDIWFEYYKESGGTLENLKDFQQLFVYMLFNPTTHIVNQRLIQIDFNTCINRIHGYYNEKFKNG